ncbi:Protein grainyhead [Toxocara canis]|uniref:Protein grainyhead n=1 Tax=Toxocara canis TaxID=6265 RepID=A0A0B2URV6_TOXCA|nr:Protein grainyhead [Toxocara canis]
MKLESYDSAPIIAAASAMSQSQFHLDSSSVIKTAPPGRQHDFSPKNEPIDLAPLTQPSLQDLSKMQPIEQYYSMPTYSRVYSDYAAIGLTHPAAQTSIITAPSTAAPLYYPTVFQGAAPQEWNRPMENYSYQRASALQYPQEVPQERVYKSVEMPSPVDSGIGADLSLIATSKDDFYSNSEVIHGIAERPERALSHRDSPIVIPKLENSLGFQYVLDAPISTSVRKEDDRMTYVNKGQFYTVSLDYIPDLCKPLKSATVKSQLMIVFREDKTYEEEIKTWQFWHSRQHSVKQRILEIDSKNSSGMIGQIEEIAHNAVQFYWNPTEQSSVKISIAVQCLSTDFSNQKGVKGLPLHIQIDTYDENDNNEVPFHRGYCQIKVFCDKGAERKLRDEDKRAQKRKLAGRKKSEGEYHEPCERSEFYHMSDLTKRAALFIGPDEYDSRFLDSSLAFDPLSELEPVAKRPRTSERVMLYVRKREEQIYTPLHIVPPSLSGLIQAVGEKFGVESEKVSGLFKQCIKGVTVKLDDDMLKHYCNEDTFIIEIEQASDDPSCCTVTLVEIPPSHFNQTS